MLLRAQVSLAAAIALSLSACDGPEPRTIGPDAAVLEREARIEAGAAAYAKYCALCHGARATGYAADNAPSLVSSTFLESASDELIARGVREGRPGTAMAPYGKVRGGPLDDEEIRAIVTFLRERGPMHVPLPQGTILGDAARGQAIYDASCKGCHGTRAERGNAVHLANATFLTSVSDAFLRHAIVRGRPDTPMPAFQGALRDDEIDDVVALLRSWTKPPERPRKAPAEPPPMGDVVINPNGKHPDFKPRAGRFVPIADVERALAEKKRIVIIDARAPSDWYAMHIPGSISVPYYAFSRLDEMPKDGTWIMAYCACPHHASGAVVDELKKRGYPNTAILDEGILEWKKRGYPVEDHPLPPDELGVAPPSPRAPILPRGPSAPLVRPPTHP